jgi:hypothetical protein
LLLPRYLFVKEEIFYPGWIVLIIQLIHVEQHSDLFALNMTLFFLQILTIISCRARCATISVTIL